MRFTRWTSPAALGLILLVSCTALAAPPDQSQAGTTNHGGEQVGRGSNTSGQSGSGANGHDSDQDDALQAVRSGAAEPLSAIVRGLGFSSHERLLNARLVHLHGRLLYDLTLATDGLVQHVLVDAKSGRRAAD
jgi:hypothetical protein